MESTLLNLIPSSYIPEVHLSQYDIGRELTFKLMDGNTEYSVPSGAVVTVKATKPSGLGFVVDAEADGNIVTLSNTETMTNESGRFSAELSISSGATLLGTSNFIFNIERSPHPEGTTDGDAETLIPELTLLVNEIRESNAKVESMTASATSLPSGSEPTAEYDPDTNNLAFGIPVPEVTAEDLYKAFITKSANGSIASFSDGGDDLPMKSLKVNITPNQSGSGDPSPSNVRPISGWDSVNIKRLGNGLFYPTQAVSQTINGITITSSGGAFHIYGTSTDAVTTNIFPVNPLVFPSDSAYKVYLGNRTADSNVEVDFYNGTTRLDYWICSSVNRAINMPQSAMSGNTCNGLLFKIPRSVTVDIIVAPYIAKAGDVEEITTNLPQTVYGGVLDVVSGKLTAFPYYSSYNGQTLNGEWICDRAVYSQGVTPPTGSQVVDMSGTGSELTLTPTEVKTLLGNNNIWSESGTVEVEYRADSTLAYNELVAMILENIGG